MIYLSVISIAFAGSCFKAGVLERCQETSLSGVTYGVKTPKKKRESPLKYPGMNAGAIDGKALITSPGLQTGVSEC
jgi:hypothetical protein